MRKCLGNEASSGLYPWMLTTAVNILGSSASGSQPAVLYFVTCASSAIVNVCSPLQERLLLEALSSLLAQLTSWHFPKSQGIRHDILQGCDFANISIKQASCLLKYTNLTGTTCGLENFFLHLNQVLPPFESVFILCVVNANPEVRWSLSLSS